MSLFFNAVVEDGETTYSLTTGGYTVVALLLFAAILVACFFKNTKDKQKFSTRQLVVSAMCVALAFVLSNVKIIKLPQGGSVTLLSMFFICFVGYLYGLRSGLMAGLAYGLLQMMVDTYIVSFPQLMFDYIFAFMALGLSGLTSTKKFGLYTGYIIGILGRMIFAVISGVIFFGMYAPEGQNVWIYSLGYNGLYIITEAAITIVVLLIPAVRDGLNSIRIAVNEADSKRINVNKLAS